MAIAASNSFSSSSVPSSSVIRKFSESMVEENIANAELIISKWASAGSSPITFATSLFHHRKEAEDFLKCVKDLRRAMHFLVLENRASYKLVLAQNLMQIAMKRLEKELYLILSSHREQLDPESVSGQSSDGSNNFKDEDKMGSEDEIILAGESIDEVEKEATYAMSDLSSIADCMISAGYGKEYVRIYKVIRKSIVEEGLHLLGVERFRSSMIQKMNWEDLEHLIKNWLKGVKIAVKTLFSGEKDICDHVFSASETLRESCFSEITKEGAINLFRFPELITKIKRSPERIFPLMELHEALSILWPKIELIFKSESTTPIKQQALSSLRRLGESVRSILSDFGSSIEKDSSKTPVIGGGVHPLTRTAMNYLSSLADYGGILSEIVSDSPPLRSRTLLESYFECPNSDDSSAPTVSVYFAWLILVLLCKLDCKAEAYRDVSLSYLFLSNNLQFIIQKVCSTRLKFLLGEDWIFKHTKKLKQYAGNYEIIAWNKVFSSLPQKPYKEFSPEAVKDCFQRFTAEFQQAYRKHTSWIVPDRKFRDELKVSIAKKLVPAYKDFCDTYLATLTEEKNLEMLTRFSPDDLGNYLSDILHGASISDCSSIASSSSSMSRGCMILPR